MMKGLLIRSPWIDLILDGHKVWEMRSTSTRQRGRIALIKAGSGQIVGSAVLTESLAPLSLQEMYASVAKHGIPQHQVREAFERGWNTPWVLDGVEKLPAPKPYAHPRGAVTWVNLPEYRDAPGSQKTQTTRQGSEPTCQQIGTQSYSPPAVDARHSEVWAEVTLTAANLRWNHIYLREVAGLLPADCLGGPNRKSLGRPITVKFSPGMTVDTDVASDKMILRSRGAVRDFLEQSGATPGDSVRISRKGHRTFVIALHSRSGRAR